MRRELPRKRTNRGTGTTALGAAELTPGYDKQTGDENSRGAKPDQFGEMP